MKPASAALAALLVLAACGADGPPQPPDTAERSGPQLTISGQARFGVSRGL